MHSYINSLKMNRKCSSLFEERYFTTHCYRFLIEFLLEAKRENMNSIGQIFLFLICGIYIIVSVNGGITATTEQISGGKDETKLVVTVTDQEWENFKNTFHKKYLPEEDIKRREIYLKNKIAIIKHNMEYDKGLQTYKVDINHLSDATPPNQKIMKV